MKCFALALVFIVSTTFSGFAAESTQKMEQMQQMKSGKVVRARTCKSHGVGLPQTCTNGPTLK
jgi:hypothetical protein